MYNRYPRGGIMVKKVIQIIVAVMLFVGLSSNVYAKENKILDYARSTHIIAGDVVKLSASDIVKIERFLNENEISDADQDSIIAKLDSIITILNKNGTSNVTMLDASTKEQILSIAKDAAQIAGVTLTYDNTDKVLSIYKNGVMVDAFFADPYLKQTGDTNVMIIVGTLLIIAGATLVIKKVKHA